VDQKNTPLLRSQLAALEQLSQILDIPKVEATAFLSRIILTLKTWGLKANDINHLRKGSRNGTPVVTVDVSKRVLLPGYILSFSIDAVLVDFTDCTPILGERLIPRNYLTPNLEDNFDEDVDDYEWKLNHSSAHDQSYSGHPDYFFDPIDDN
jgi:pSer/pThr/pTyr-binding forkhead associated (FHA) protein